MMLDILTLQKTTAEAVLWFANTNTMIGIGVIGFVIGSRQAFGQAMIMLLFTLGFNPLLKSFFKVPLFPHLPQDGYAFPSGHMQRATALYATIAWRLGRPMLYGLIALLLAGIFAGEVYMKYHTPGELAAGIVAALLTLAAFAFLLRTRFGNSPARLGLFLSLILGLIMVYMIMINTGQKPAKVIQGFWYLLGFSAGWRLCERSLQGSMNLVFGTLCIATLAAWVWFGGVVMAMGSAALYACISVLPEAIKNPLGNMMADASLGFIMFGIPVITAVFQRLQRACV